MTGLQSDDLELIEDHYSYSKLAVKTNLSGFMAKPIYLEFALVFLFSRYMVIAVSTNSMMSNKVAPFSTATRTFSVDLVNL